jgi:SrtB family sortase
MKAEIIGIGNQSLYQNFFEACCEYLQRELSSLGIGIGSRRLVPGQSQEVFDRLREASRQGDLVVVLPAAEPGAAQAAAQAIAAGLGLEIRSDPALEEQLAQRAARQGKDYSREELAALAGAPAGSLSIPNPSGMIQGYAIRAQKQLMLVLPGVPSELAVCFSGSVRRLLEGLGGSASAQRTLRAVELGETPLRDQLAPLLHSENPKLTLHSRGNECEIHISATGATRAEAQAACDAMARQVETCLGAYLTSGQGEPLGQQVARLFQKHGLTLAVAEAGTAGLLAEAIKEGQAALDGARVLAGGMNLATDAQKTERLGVPKKLITEAGGVSRRVAAAMAAAVRQKGKASLGAAITCRPQAREGKEAGLLYVAITDGRQVWAKKVLLPEGAEADDLRSTACLQALNMLRLYAQQYPEPLPGGVAMSHAVPGKGGAAGIAAAVSGLLPKGKKSNKKTGTQPRNGGASGENHEKESKEMNLIQKIRYRKLEKSDITRLVILCVSLLVFIGCMVYIGSVFLESYRNKGLVADQQSAYSNSNIRPEDVEGYPSDYLPKFAALYAQNPDVAGWIKIDGTKYLDMVVVQTTDNDYYERRDFTRADNNHGVAFVDYRVAQKEPSTNTIIYAHNMNDGQMFGELLNYKSLEYYRQHPLISYDSVYYEGMYKIFGVVICKKDDPDFLYHNFIEKLNDQEMVDFVNKIRERSIINTKVDVRTDDKLLTLSTCDYSFKSDTGERIARFVVFARKVRDGESTEVDTAGATINTNPVMPQEWYDYLKKQQEEELKKQQEEAAALAANKWLTEDEKATLSAEEQQTLAQKREELAQLYLTYDEREELDLDTMIYYIERRQEDFALFLDNDESGYSLSKRISLTEERRQMAEDAGLTNSEIREAGSWEKIQELIAQRGSAALDAIIQKYPNLLTSADKNSYTTAQALENLAAQRRQQAESLGLNVANYATWADLSAAIQAAQSGSAERQQFIKDYQKWLNSNPAGTLDELRNQVALRQNEYNELLNSLKGNEAYADIARQLEQKVNSASVWSDIQAAMTTAREAADKIPVGPVSPSSTSATSTTSNTSGSGTSAGSSGTSAGSSGTSAGSSGTSSGSGSETGGTDGSTTEPPQPSESTTEPDVPDGSTSPTSPSSPSETSPSQSGEGGGGEEPPPATVENADQQPLDSGDGSRADA